MSILFTIEQVVFEDIIEYPDISIEEGKITFLVGDSGSGKSSLLRLLNGIQSPAKGIITYQGKNITTYDTIWLRRQVLLAGQSVYLFDKTIRENFEEYYAYRELVVPSEEEMIRYLKLCCLDFPLDANCTLLSGGERQRVYLAIFLSFQPKVLMLDEPTSALDAQTSVQFLENVTSYCKQHQITLIVVSHDRTLTERFAQEKITLMGRAFE